MAHELAARAHAVLTVKSAHGKPREISYRLFNSIRPHTQSFSKQI